MVFSSSSGSPQVYSDISPLNLTIVSARKTYIPWTVLQIEPGLTFSQLLLKILGRTYPMLPVEAHSKLDKVFVG
jgi:hypothetical protein